ncbi:esterase-like activity of phytase family protein [Gordonia sp. CPCC 205333]|uniref:esterase-like activity of phytase family protein n=1 Tax=Gordonia sp. CPCC 205333 TaxID=3140790 RepID=UPI003AF3FB98
MRLRSGLPLALVSVAVIATSCSNSVDDGAAVTTNGGRPVTLTAADLHNRFDDAAIVEISDGAHGKVRLNADGSLTYSPAAGYTGTDSVTVTTTDAVQLYSTDIPPMTTTGGVPIQGSAYGSAWVAVPGSADEYYGLTDRGPNVDGRNKNEKVEPVADFTPQIGRFRLRDGVATLISTVKLAGRDGKPLNGQVNPLAATGETIVDLDGKTLPPSDHGLDTEGLVALPDGTFWISDEYGPFLVHFDATGREIERLSPFDGGLPRELALRSPNQGMEGLTITPDGNTLVGIMQSALDTPGLDGSAKKVPLSRIVTVDLKTKQTHEYLYPLTDPKDTGVAVSEITALSSTTFLVDERDGKTSPKGDKKIYTVDIAGATDVGPRSAVAGTHYDATAGGLLVGTKPLETLVGTATTDKAVGILRDANITPVTKKLKVDLGKLVAQLNPAGDFYGHDKIEGLWPIDGGTRIVVSNDSDFGIDGLADEKTPMKLAEKTLPNGTQDNGEILVIDTGKLPATTQKRALAFHVE